MVRSLLGNMKIYAIAAGLIFVFITTIALTYTIVAQTNQSPITTDANAEPTIVSEINKPVLGEFTQENEELINRINYWKKVVIDYPNYRDGYMQLAILTYQIGNMVASINYVEKVLELDPNYQPAKELRDSISSGN